MPSLRRMASTDTIACLRCGTRFHKVCVVHSLDDAQTQDGLLINAGCEIAKNR